MTKEEFQKLLHRYKNNRFTERQLLAKVSALPFESLGFATVDHHRHLRKGFPEVILAEGKTPAQVAAIAQRIARNGAPLLATRASLADFRAVKKKIARAHYHPESRTITANEPKNPEKNRGVILVITAGTSDIPVAEEAAITAWMAGNPVEKLYDVGVAGIHRLLMQGDALQRANVIIVVAGMEGALPSVVGGLVDAPVIAVPTSVGYGASFQGVAALLGMLNTCASGVTVVNIDNGFGAGFAASIINKRSK
jgi:hypothetical protein